MNFKILGILFFKLSLMNLFMSLVLLNNNNIMMLNISMLKIYMCDMNFYFFLDSMNLIFSSTILLISSMVFFYSESYMTSEKYKLSFIVLTFIFVLSMLFMIFSLNMVMILLGWDGLGLSSYCLVIFYQNSYSNYAGMITILTNRLGDISMILALSLMMNFFFLDFFNFCLDVKIMKLFMVLMILASFTKSAQYPFSAWLPAAMAAPTPISSLVHSSTLVTAGVYILVRISLILNFNIEFSYNMMIISMMTLFLGGFIALFEKDFKKVIALSTLSQLGLMMLMMSLGHLTMSFFHLITHAVFKSLLFLCAGVIIHNFYSKQYISSFSLNLKSNPLISNIFLLSSLALTGFPFLSGFYSKDLILEMFYINNMNYLILIMLILATIFTVLYSMRIFFYIFINCMNMNMFLNNQNLDLNLNLTIFFMSFNVILVGNFMFWFLFSSDFMFYMKMNVKLFNLMFILFMFLYLYFNNFKFKMKFFMSKFLKFYCLNMFLMSTFFGKLSNYLLFKSKVVMNMELMNEKMTIYNQFMIMNMLSFFFTKNLKVEMKFIIMFMMMMLLMLI